MGNGTYFIKLLLLLSCIYYYFQFESDANECMGSLAAVYRDSGELHVSNKFDTWSTVSTNLIFKKYETCTVFLSS